MSCTAGKISEMEESSIKETEERSTRKDIRGTGGSALSGMNSSLPAASSLYTFPDRCSIIVRGGGAFPVAPDLRQAGKPLDSGRLRIGPSSRRWRTNLPSTYLLSAAIHLVFHDICLFPSPPTILLNLEFDPDEVNHYPLIRAEYKSKFPEINMENEVSNLYKTRG